MENLRGAALMTLAMLGFSIEDMVIKLMAGAVPTWQIIAILGAGGATVFAMATRMRGQPLFSRAYLNGAVILRNLGELIGTMSFITAIALTPISSASAVLQATPLFVTLGAAVFLDEPVGWRRWSAILVGFLGVLLVIQPWGAQFDINLMFAVLAVVCLGTRDIATRRISGGISSLQLSFLAFLMLIPAAGFLSILSPQPYVAPDAALWGMALLTVLLGVLAYYAIVAAMRVGEVSFVTPFRYSRMIFALIVGVVVFGEQPDALMLLGAAIIIGSGIYTVWRERKHRPAA